MKTRMFVRTACAGLLLATAAHAEQVRVVGGRLVINTMEADVTATFLGDPTSGLQSQLFVDAPNPSGSAVFNNKSTPVGTVVTLVPTHTAAGGTEVRLRNRVSDTDDYTTGFGIDNPDGIPHAAFVWNNTQVAAPVTVGFEDLRGGGDNDFNDMQVRLTNVVVTLAAAPAAFGSGTFGTNEVHQNQQGDWQAFNGLRGSMTNKGTIVNRGEMVNYGTLANDGKITNQGRMLSDLETRFTNSLSFENSGSLSLLGSLENTGSITNTGSMRTVGESLNQFGGNITNQAASAFENAGSLTNGGLIDNTGTMRNVGNMLNDFASGAAGTFRNQAGGYFENDPTFVQAGNTFTNRGNLVNAGTFRNVGNMLNDFAGGAAGTFENQFGGTFENGDRTFTNLGTVTNAGTFRNVGTMVNDFAGGAAGAFRNEFSAMFENDGSFVNRGSFRNDGEMTGGGSYTQTGSGASTVVNGSFRGESFDIQGGSLSGSGTISAPTTVREAAWFSPGNSPGTMQIDGRFDMYGTLDIEIARWDDFDRLVVSGPVLLDGTVNFKFIDGFTPWSDDRFTWLEGEEILLGNRFQYFVTGADDMLFDLIFSADGHSLTLAPVSAAPVPLPAAAWLLMSGLAGLGIVARGRRGATPAGTHANE